MMKKTYLAIKEEMEEKIRSGEYKPGDRLKSEMEMAKMFGVSRETFRSAVKLMEQENKLLVKHGVGTFIVNPLPEIPSSLEKLYSIGALIQTAGLVEGERQESISVMPCREEWAKPLGLEPGTPVVALERIRTANEEAVSFSLNIIPLQIVGDAFEKHEFSGSLFSFLEQTCGIRIIGADSELVVPLHTDRYCQKLLIKPESTVLLMKQTHYDELNRPVLYSLDYLRNDIFRFWVRRMRD
ncbi:GntR family transcriptional regulator [Brevibacillus nitrificans]|uniref:GntR family transcriptional regulator n=1 Tax=Brevibacillus nitrificans TaxID=651560 RepID=UPI00285B6DB1|nr:GntR family transcriptional regulator [Brevibacillus nitrificans]MDR7318264.1 GntR family transcriptional regulator [Brevibacillus nitrificans]